MERSCKGVGEQEDDGMVRRESRGRPKMGPQRKVEKARKRALKTSERTVACQVDRRSTRTVARDAPMLGHDGRTTSEGHDFSSDEALEVVGRCALQTIDQLRFSRDGGCRPNTDRRWVLA